MTPATLQTIIRAELSTAGPTTTDDLLERIRSRDPSLPWSGSLRSLSKSRLLQNLRALVSAGDVERVAVPGGGSVFRVVVPRYSCAEGTSATAGWELRRDDLGEDGTYVIGSSMTEAEARVCVAALNDHDCRVRAVRGKS